MTLLLVTASAPQERLHWQDQLNSYLWTLRTMSKSSEPMRYAANRLEGAILRGLEHALAVNVDEPSYAQLQHGDRFAEPFFADADRFDLSSVELGSFDWLGSIEPGDLV
jgi:hypothetical protein